MTFGNAALSKFHATGNRRISGVTGMGKNSSVARATTVGRETTVTNEKFPAIRNLDNSASRQVFQAVVYRLDVAKLAEASRRSKECARLWRQGRKFPDAHSLINMARKIPEIKAWLYHEVERQDEGFDSDRTLTASYETLIKLAAMPGRKGDAARAAIGEMVRIAAAKGSA